MIIFRNFIPTSVVVYTGPLRIRISLPLSVSQLLFCIFYIFADLTNRKGFWAKAVNERLVDKDVTLYFYVSKSGTVYYGIDGRTKDEFFQGVDVSGPLWAMIDVYGNSTAVELVNVRLNNSLNDDQEAGFGLSDYPRY